MRPIPQIPFFAIDSVFAMAWEAVSIPFVALGRATGLLPPLPVSPTDLDLSDAVILLTGGNTGIGKRTATNLARLGAQVVIAVRSLERGSAAVADIKAELPAARVSCMTCDLGSLASVDDFSDVFREKYGRLDVLINNAGLNTSGRTADGYEQLFAVNFLGHFRLTLRLLDLLEASAAAAAAATGGGGGSGGGVSGRIVNLASVMHRFGTTAWETSATGNKVGGAFSSSYSDSKLAMVLFTQELRRRFRTKGSLATAIAVNPGAVRSDIWRAMPRPIRPVFQLLSWLMFLDADQGSYTSVCAAALPTARLVAESGGGGAGMARAVVAAEPVGAAGAASTTAATADPELPEYVQPYWLPFGFAHPFELMGPFVGCRTAAPSLPPEPEAGAARLWEVCERLIAAAEAKRR